MSSLVLWLPSDPGDLSIRITELLLKSGKAQFIILKWKSAGEKKTCLHINSEKHMQHFSSIPDVAVVIGCHALWLVRKL